MSLRPAMRAFIIRQCWLVKRLQNAYPTNSGNTLLKRITSVLTDVAVCKSKNNTTPATVGLAYLKDAGIERICPLSRIIPTRTSGNASSGTCFYPVLLGGLRNPSRCLCAEGCAVFLALRTVSNILDLCAAPGGKTTHSAPKWPPKQTP